MCITYFGKGLVEAYIQSTENLKMPPIEWVK